MDARFPIGPLQVPERRDAGTLQGYADALQHNARDFRNALLGLGPTELVRTYRAGSFSVRQLVHHVADAHEQGFMRFRWGLTERVPAILSMNEAAWAQLPDYALPPELSLAVFEGVNARWVAVLGGLDPEQLDYTVLHPQEGEHDLWRLLAKHEWHVRHHLAHIRLALRGLDLPGASRP